MILVDSGEEQGGEQMTIDSDGDKIIGNNE